MKIAELLQPYKRMAEYLGDENNTIRHSLSNYFFIFYNKMHKGENPEITEEIKQYFPPDFDFSGEEVTKPVMQMLDIETQKYIYTQLAKDGKFDQLPATCEFSEAVELEVWDSSQLRTVRQITGKYKDMYVDDDFDFWDNAKLFTHKIDFSEFKSGDVVEVELSNEEKRIGWFDYADRNQVVIKTLQRKGNQVCNGGSCSGSKMFNLEKIKLITKIK